MKSLLLNKKFSNFQLKTIMVLFYYEYTHFNIFSRCVIVLQAGLVWTALVLQREEIHTDKLM